MTSIEYGQKLYNQFGVELGIELEDCIKAIQQEGDDIREEPPVGMPRKPSQSEALAMAYSHLADWLTSGQDYGVKLTWGSLAQFVLQHRKACAWAVLVAKRRLP